MTQKLPWCSSLSTADLEPRHVKQNTGVYEQLQPKKTKCNSNNQQQKTKRVTANLQPGKKTVRTNF